MVANKAPARYIVTKEWVEGPNKGKRFKEICDKRLTVKHVYKPEDETHYMVVHTVKLETAIKQFEAGV